MPILEIQNCHVHISGEDVSLGCECDSARYHVWLNADRSVRAPLYKNPLEPVNYGSAAYYRTRKLSTTSRSAAALIAAMLTQMQRESLYEKALEVQDLARLEDEKRRRFNEVNHLLVAGNSEGQLFFLSDDGYLTPDIREATVFTNAGRDQAETIAANPQPPKERIYTALTLISITAGQLALLSGTAAQSDLP